MVGNLTGVNGRRGKRWYPDPRGRLLQFKASGPLPPSQTLLANARSQILQVNPTGQSLLAIAPPCQGKTSGPNPPGQSLWVKHSWPILQVKPHSSDHLAQSLQVNPPKPTFPSTNFLGNPPGQIIPANRTTSNLPGRSQSYRSTLQVKPCGPIFQVNPSWPIFLGPALLANSSMVTSLWPIPRGPFLEVKPSGQFPPRGQTLLANPPGHFWLSILAILSDSSSWYPWHRRRAVPTTAINIFRQQWHIRDRPSCMFSVSVRGDRITEKLAFRSFQA